MALATYEEVRKWILDETPVQFCTNLEILEGKMASKGFTSLRDCLLTPINKGGVGLELSKVKEMLYYNPRYKHKADALMVKLELVEMAKVVQPQPTISESLLGNKSAGKNGTDKKENISPVSDYGTGSAYRIAKLKRDHPEVASRLMSGEFKSVSEAERAAGIPGREKMTPVAKVIAAFERLSEADQMVVRVMIKATAFNGVEVGDTQ